MRQPFKSKCLQEWEEWCCWWWVALHVLHTESRYSSSRYWREGSWPNSTGKTLNLLQLFVIIFARFWSNEPNPSFIIQLGNLSPIQSLFMSSFGLESLTQPPQRCSFLVRSPISSILLAPTNIISRNEGIVFLSNLLPWNLMHHPSYLKDVQLPILLWDC